MPFYIKGPVRFVQLFLRSMEDAGEYLSSALFDDNYKGGWSLMDADAKKS